MRVIQKLMTWKKLCSNGNEVSNVGFWFVKPHSYAITDASGAPSASLYSGLLCRLLLT